MISLIIISGRSGSGKSTALHVLEDIGYYCIDNLPAGLIEPLLMRVADNQLENRICVSIDARNVATDLANFPEIIKTLDPAVVSHQIIYLDTDSDTLVKRFSETRRKHPLSGPERSLREALDLETEMLDPISGMADLSIDTTDLNIHDLRDMVRTRVVEARHEFALLFRSFAFKAGVPIDTDIVFDVRCLPNPHWDPDLRALTGRDQPVVDYLDAEADVQAMFDDIRNYLEKWLPRFEANNRTYMTVAIGCTGGQHRSVYMCERLHEYFTSRWRNVQLRHRELDRLATRVQEGKAS